MNDAQTNEGFIAKYPVLSFLILTFAISWSMATLMGITIATEKAQIVGVIGMIFVGQFGPSAAAFIVVKKLQGWRGFRAHLRSAYSIKQPVKLIAFAVLFYPALLSFIVFVSILRGAPIPDLSAVLSMKMLLIFLPALALGLVFGGISEEFGFRGFLLPRLQDRFGFLVAGLIIGVLWAVWHLDPEHIAVLMKEGWSPFWAKESVNLAAYLKETIPGSFIMLWLFNRSKGSILLMIVIHSSWNACVGTLPILWVPKPDIWGDTSNVIVWVTAAFAVLATFRLDKVTLDAGERESAQEADESAAGAGNP